MTDFLKKVRQKIFDGKNQSFIFKDGDENKGMKTKRERTAEIDEEINRMTNVELLDAISGGDTSMYDEI